MTMRPAVSIAILLAAVPVARGAAPARAQTELQALRLERQLDVLDGVLAKKRDRTLLETLAPASLAAVFAAWAPGGDVSLFATRSAPQPPGTPEEAAAAKAANAPWVELRRETSALELQQALLADQLQRYKETGILSPTPPETVKAIKRLLGQPWGVLPPSEPEAPFLRGGLVELQKQLSRYEGLGRRPPAARRPAAPRLAVPRPAPQPPLVPRLRIPLPPAAAPVRLLFEADAGTGRPQNDPIPDLIVLLSSSQARGRALAADELGNLGAQAAKAVPALRLELSDPDRRVRASAAQALGTIGAADPNVLDGLQRALNDPNEEVRLSARASLQRLQLAFPQRPFPAFAPR